MQFCLPYMKMNTQQNLGGKVKSNKMQNVNTEPVILTFA